MTTCDPACEFERLTPPDTREALRRGVRRGLLACPRSLSPWMFYDREGSRLFERITQQPEYYLTRIEHSMLASSAAAIIAEAKGHRSGPLRLVEPGAGTASKTAVLLDAVVRLQGGVLYIPVDVSDDALGTAREQIALSLPGVRVEPIVANYVTHPPQLASFSGTTLAVYLGSSIGNFTPEEARAILQNLNSQLKSGDGLLLGTDMVKDESILVAAYDDGVGATAEFNLNILGRLNRDLEADFDLANFRHRALWNARASRIEMHLESTCDHHVCIPRAGINLGFRAFETIHTENSYKFTRNGIRTLLEDAGFVIERTWTDLREWYALTLARIP